MSGDNFHAKLASNHLTQCWVQDFSHLCLDVTNPGLSNIVIRWILRPEAPDDGKPAEFSLTDSHSRIDVVLWQA